MKARKRPVVVEAVKFEGFSSVTGHALFNERPEWLIKEFGNRITFFDKPNTLTIATLEGKMIADTGFFIVQGVQGELYPCKPDIFLETYEIIEE